jgi:hypothetical protein
MFFFLKPEEPPGKRILDDKILDPVFLLPGDDEICPELWPGRIDGTLREAPWKKISGRA